MDKYKYLFEKAINDFFGHENNIFISASTVNINYLLDQYNVSNRSMILKQNNMPIGFLIMDDIYYHRINEFVHFVKYLWIDDKYRHKHFGSNVLNNITNLKHLYTNSTAAIILNVEKNSNTNDFYIKNNFIKIYETEMYIMYKR